MARPEHRLKQNAEGLFFVDTNCINCGVSGHYAPEIFGDTGEYAYVKRQPRDEAETLPSRAVDAESDLSLAVDR